MTEESFIQYDAKGRAVSFVGPDAIQIFRAAALASAMGLYKVGIRPNRHLSATQALKMATEYTGVKYKRGEYDRARDDLSAWVQRAKAVIPTMQREA